MSGQSLTYSWFGKLISINQASKQSNEVKWNQMKSNEANPSNQSNKIKLIQINSNDTK